MVCDIFENNEEIRRLIKEMEQKSKVWNREIAISVCNGGIASQIGDENSVRVPLCPLNAVPKVVIHTHTRTPNPSVNDLKVSQKVPVCLVFNGLVRCFFRGREVCRLRLD